MVDFNNQNFLLGLVINKDRDNRSKILGGLQASEFKGTSPVGVILMKQNVDRIRELETSLATAETGRTKAQQDLDAANKKLVEVTAERDALDNQLKNNLAGPLNAALAAAEGRIVKTFDAALADIDKDLPGSAALDGLGDARKQQIVDSTKAITATLQQKVVGALHDK